MNTPETCPRFTACGANVCPLDPQWNARRHLKDEPVCSMLMEAVKVGGAERLRDKLPPAAAEAVLSAASLIAAKWPDISKRLERAAKSSTRRAPAEVTQGCTLRIA